MRKYMILAEMSVKKIIVCVLLTLFTAKVFPGGQAGTVGQSMTLDEAIRTTASELGQRINANRISNVVPCNN